METSAEQAFVAALAGAATPEHCYAALETLARRTIGLRLFTVMRTDMEAGLARRTYTSHPADYPASGTKPIHHNAWFAQMERGEIFVASRLQDHPDQFPDHETLAALGCGSVVNVPVHVGSRMIGAVNLLDAEGAFEPAMAPGLVRALALPSLAALLAAERLADQPLGEKTPK